MGRFWCLFFVAGVICSVVTIISVFVVLAVHDHLFDNGRVHNVLQDAVLSNVSVSVGNSTSQAAITSGTLTFKIWSRNANKKLGVDLDMLQLAVFYNKYELGVAYALPFLLFPRGITTYDAPLQLSNLDLPPKVAAALEGDLEAGEVPFQIFVNIGATYTEVDNSWSGVHFKVKDKCAIIISMDTTTGSSSLKGKQCGWTIRRRRRSKRDAN